MCEIVIPEIHTFKKLESSQIICDDFISVPSMALILLVQVQSRVFTAKCSEPQVGISNEDHWCLIPEGVDPELLMKVLGNPEMAALLTSLAKSMKM